MNEAGRDLTKGLGGPSRLSTNDVDIDARVVPPEIPHVGIRSARQ